MSGLKKIMPALLAAAVLVTGCAREVPVYQTDVFAMDTLMTVKFSGGNETLLEQVREEIHRFEKLWDVNDEKSDIYRLNHSHGEKTAVSEETAFLTARALELSARTEGALDISIYPVLRAWGFTTGQYEVPDSRTLSELLNKVDYRQIVVDGQHRTVQVPEGMMLDPGAVAKGFTGDRLCELLRENGVSSALLNLGGNVQALGGKPDGSAWRVAVKDPQHPDEIVCTLEIRDRAVITSGSYERYFVGKDGKTYWHILDPATGYPADKGLLSVTIIGENGLECDALSTALFVMGKDGAMTYCREHPQMEAVLIDSDRRLYLTEGLLGIAEPSEGMEHTVISRQGSDGT